MKRIARAATLTVASCALVIGGAGAATAYDGDGYKDNGKHHYGKHHDKYQDKNHGRHDYKHDRKHGNDRHDYDDDYGYGYGSHDDNTNGVAIGSPGLLSGNVVQVPIKIPINVCGNSLNLIAALNPAFGNVCINS